MRILHSESNPINVKLTQGQRVGLYLRERERWRCWGEREVLLLVGVSYVQDERNHVVLPKLHLHGYWLRGVHAYPPHKDRVRKERIFYL